MTMPFNVEAEDIKQLSDVQLTRLLNILLIAEANKSVIPLNSAAVALNITVGDGGEDGRIEWQNGPERTDFIPNRLTQFQNKATNMGPTAYAEELVTQENQLKPVVLDVLTKGGSYIVFTTQPLNTNQKNQRITKMRAKLTELALPFADTADLKIYDASQIANWVNKYLSAIVSVLSWLNRPLVRGLKPFDKWSQTSDFSDYPYIEIPSRVAQLNPLKDNLKNPRFCARIKGLSGLGKTRSTFELFKQDESLQRLVIYVDAAITESVAAWITDLVNHEMTGIIVVDNCDNELHIRIQSEIERSDSKLSFLSLDYNLEQVGSTNEIHLQPLEDDEIRQMLAPVYGDRIVDLDRIARFVQGFPQIAVLLAKARLNLSPEFGSLNDEALANRLLWGSTGARNERDELILKGCALFDRFGFTEELSAEAEYISSRLQITHAEFYDCVVRFTERGIIDRRGRYGQLVPKPLAIKLAAQWWRRTPAQAQRDLISTIPNSMIASFCDQIEKLDFLPEVKQLTKAICGPQGPFGQAEAILSVRGSRLFRSFVTVNPEATADALHNILSGMSEDELKNISGDVRRNLIWALEKLCFHREQFAKGATCLLLLASCENEEWSNNATGQFGQLFGVWLSGTEADLNARISLLQQSQQRNNLNIDLVVLKALGRALNTFGATRTIGAEYQGSGPPLIEWQPSIWQEVFDYWDGCINLLLLYSNYEDPVGESARDILANSIRGIFSRGRIDTIERVVTQLADQLNSYWPKGLAALNDVRRFDSGGMPQEGLDALERFALLLKPDEANLESQLKLYFIDPHSDYEEGPNGHYIDKSGENAQQFAESLNKNYESLIPFISLLSTGIQRYTYHLGRALMSDTEEAHSFLVTAMHILGEIDNPDAALVFGLLSKLHEINHSKWEEYLQAFYSTENLQKFSPGFLRTGDIKAGYLNQLLELIKAGKLPEISAANLIFSQDYSTITSQEIGQFASDLSEVSPAGAWAALDLLTMYSYNSLERRNSIKEPLIKVITSVSLHEEGRRGQMDFYHWTETVSDLIESEPPEFSEQITKQIITATKLKMDHVNIWNYIKKVVAKLLDMYPDKVWPLFAEEIVRSKPSDQYWIGQIFKREDSFTFKKESLLNRIPIDTLMTWCRSNPDTAPIFVATCVNIFDVKGEEKSLTEAELNSTDIEKNPNELLIKLLEEFGDMKGIKGAISANLHSRGWSGSLVPYLETDLKGLSTLINHKNPNVSSWANDESAYLRRAIEREKERDEEEKFRY